MQQQSHITERIDFIDFSKGFAMIGIVLYHYLNRSATGLMAKAIGIGGTGVHLFIIISGFGLILSSYSSTISSFYKRRFLKILIPYYLCVTFLYIFNHFIILFPESSLYAYLGHIFLYKMFDSSIFNSFEPFWFISTIIQFYLMFPLLMAIRNKLGNIPFIFITTLVSISFWFIHLKFGDRNIDIGAFQNSSAIYLWEFSIGMVFGDLYKRKQYAFWNQKINYMLPVAIIGLTLMAAMALKFGEIGKTLNDIPAAAGYMTFVIIAYSILKSIHSVFVKMFTFLGNISYELFLIHIFVILLYQKINYNSFLKNMSYIECFLMVPIAIILAIYFQKISIIVISALTKMIDSLFPKRIIG